MKKRSLLLVAISCFLFLSLTVAEAQDIRSEWELLGGVGFSYMGDEAQDEYLRVIRWNTDNASENRSFHFSPGMYATVQIRPIAHFGDFSIGFNFSLSQYSTVFNSTIERPKALGWKYQNNKVRLNEYKWGTGIFLRYLKLESNHHHFQPQLGIGLERQYAHRKVHEQEVRFHMQEEPSYFSFTESYRYRKVPPSIDNDYYWTGQLSVVYSYQKGKLIPFSELGFRFIQGIIEESWHIKEDWTLFYLNLGIRWSFKNN